MNIGSVDPNFTGRRAIAGPGKQLLVLVLYGFYTGGIYYQIKKQNRRLEFNPLELLLIRTLMLYAVKHTV
jgi:hypothetical protein